MGVFHELYMATEVDKAAKANDRKRLKQLKKAMRRQHRRRLRGEKRFAMLMKTLFGWEIPEELKDVDPN